MLSSPPQSRDGELNEASDELLMQRVRAGDAHAFSAIFDRYSSAAYALAYRICGRSPMAENVVQEAFVSLWRNASRYESSRGAVQTWALSVTRNCAVDALRRAGTVNRPPTRVATVVRADAEVPRHDQAERIRRALSTLPADQRVAIELAYFDGLTHHEISRRLSLAPGSAKRCIRLGLQRLRVALDDSRGEDRPPNVGLAGG